MDKSGLNFSTVPIERVHETAIQDAPLRLDADDAVGLLDGPTAATSISTFPAQADRPWQRLCEAIIQENDPSKMLHLVERLNASLDEVLGNSSN